MNKQLFIGRFQPFHIGHKMIIDGLDNPVLGIIKGKISSKNKERNPFSLDFQLEMIRSVYPDIDIVVHDQGYVPDIIDKVDGNVSAVICGEDRISDYTRQTKNLDVDVIVADRFTSGTKIRELIKNKSIEGDLVLRDLLPKPVYKMLGRMRGI